MAYIHRSIEEFGANTTEVTTEEKTIKDVFDEYEKELLEAEGNCDRYSIEDRILFAEARRSLMYVKSYTMGERGISFPMLSDPAKDVQKIIKLYNAIKKVFKALKILNSPQLENALTISDAVVNSEANKEANNEKKQAKDMSDFGSATNEKAVNLPGNGDIEGIDLTSGNSLEDAYNDMSDFGNSNEEINTEEEYTEEEDEELADFMGYSL